MLFIDVINVTEFPDSITLEENDPKMYKNWWDISNIKYDGNVNMNYYEKAIYYPEYTKIVGITTATVETDADGNLKRNFRKFKGDDEVDILKQFTDYLQLFNNDPILVGDDIINTDIPLYMKRLLKNRDKITTINLLPKIIKKYLDSKPWDIAAIDTSDIWKFNGVNKTPLSSIADFLNLKTNIEIKERHKLSEYYWENIKKNKTETYKELFHHSANKLNLLIQLLYMMKNL